MKSIIVSVVVCFGLVACAIPNLGSIDLSGCTKTCNDTAKVCFDTANNNVNTCLAQDAGNTTYDDAGLTLQEDCLQKQTKAGENCITDLTDCFSVCVKQTEDQLKK